MVAKDYVLMSKVFFEVPDGLKRRFKMKCFREQSSMAEVFTKLMRRYLNDK